MDWNWFYSAVAQSSAAIIGVFSAFIINKIINNQVQYKKNNNKIEELIAESEYLKEKTNNRFFDWYNEKIRNSGLNVIENEIEKSKEIKSKEHYYKEYEFSLYDNKNEILNKIEKLITKKKKQLNQESSKKNYLKIRKPNININPKQTNAEAEKINELFTDIKNHTRKITNFHNSIKDNPQSSKLITISIICVKAMFIFGVLLPLAYLPYEEGFSFEFSFNYILNQIYHPKVIILFIVSIIFLALMTKFLSTNKKLKYNNKKLKKLKKYADIKNYSTYFENRVENEN